MIAAELLVRADLLTDELFQARLFRTKSEDDPLERAAHLARSSSAPASNHFAIRGSNKFRGIREDTSHGPVAGAFRFRFDV